MFSQGVDPELDLSNIPKLCEVYERVTRMRVYERQPYSGKLVFAAFSGSHQDAIAKGMKHREGKDISWTVPYLPIDPTDLGRVYEADVIRINSQSGKGGIGYILETGFNLNLPSKMRESFGYHVKRISDREHRELLPKEIYDIFMTDFVNNNMPLDVVKTTFADSEDGIEGIIVIKLNDSVKSIHAGGNGRLNCVSNAIKIATGLDYMLESYTQHALDEHTTASAASYVSIIRDSEVFWGVGIDSDIGTSSIKALVSAVNKILKAGK
jgi:2-isopropylmalate synthase